MVPHQDTRPAEEAGVERSAEKNFPDVTSYDALALGQLCTSITKTGLAYWQKLRGDRAYPAREDLAPRDMAGLLTYMALVKVIDDGADFELRIVGDEVTRAYRAPLLHRRLSDLARDLPHTAANWQTVNRRVFDSRRPYALSIKAGHDTPEVNFRDAEILCLPLGPDERTVDHVISFGMRALCPIKLGLA
ncbi:MAG: PAS domain-containing protein [Alphaproteobacteria bacterium]|nr:PAS domain-containing protein [Alphaproteobacteria bacterium]